MLCTLLGGGAHGGLDGSVLVSVGVSTGVLLALMLGLTAAHVANNSNRSGKTGQQQQQTGAQAQRQCESGWLSHVQNDAHKKRSGRRRHKKQRDKAFELPPEDPPDELHRKQGKRRFLPRWLRSLSLDDILSRQKRLLARRKRRGGGGGRSDDDDDEFGMDFAQHVSGNGVKCKLTKSQTEALRHVRKVATSASDKEKKTLRDRLCDMGVKSVQDVLHTMARGLNVIIHIPTNDVLAKLARDTHVRNQFETNTSRGYLNGGARKQWEELMFGTGYGDASGFERVKYGVLNFLGHKDGSTRASQYGDSYLVTKGLHWRCTVENGDSGKYSRDYPVGLLDEPGALSHIVNRFTDDELKSIAGCRVDRHKMVEKSYKEVQIHGEVRLDRDIEALVMDPAYRNKDLARVAARMCKAKGIKLLFKDELR